MANNSSIPSDRVYSVDILRGLLACGVMFYHYTTWSKVELRAFLDTQLHKVGIYCVEAFFVVSGFSLYLAYHGRMFENQGGLRRYAVNHAFRLWPVYILAIAGTVAITLSAFSALQIAENAALLFGFYDSGPAIPIGG